jgi:hypothetical protein
MVGLEALLRPGYSYAIATGTASAQGTRVTPIGVVALRLCATQDCWVNIGPPSSAVAGATTTYPTSMLIRASLPGEIFKANNGDQISVIQSGTAGVLNVTEMTR